MTAAGAQSVTVNAAGAMIARGTDTFTYDQANRLTSSAVAGTTEIYAYDGDGVRFSRQVGAGPVIRYVTDANRGLPVTIDDGSRKYVWGQGLAYNVAGSTLEVYHADRLGSIRLLTDAAGTVTATSRFDEWGIPTSSTGTSTQPFRFTGEPTDASGLSYLRARYLDPTLGRLLTRDPLEPGSHRVTRQNRYLYAAARPCTLADHAGTTPTSRSLGQGGSHYNVGECVAGLVGGEELAFAGILQVAGGVLLQGGSITLFGATFGAATPVSAGGLIAGAGLEVTGLITDAAALGLVYKTCLDQ